MLACAVARVLGISLLSLLAGCKLVLGIDQFSVHDDEGCTTHAQCAASATSDAEFAADHCVDHACRPLLSTDCASTAGPASDERAILLGLLLAKHGPLAATNRLREQSAVLAIEEINAAGGIPSSGAQGRPLALLSCDAQVDLLRAARHLHTLGVSAIIGPDTSQATIDLSRQLTIGAGMLVLTPTALAGSIRELLDDDLDWTMVPSIEQRAPLMNRQIVGLESELEAARERPLKLSIVFRDDALGRATLATLNGVLLDGKPLSDPDVATDRVRIAHYGVGDSDLSPLVEAQLRFAPDLLVLVGQAEVVTMLMAPLERRWGDADGTRSLERPHYLLTDASKVPELLELAARQTDLAFRVRGTGVAPSLASAAVYDAFRQAYQARFSERSLRASGLGSTHDAVYALAFALALPPSAASGGQLAAALHDLSLADTLVPLQPSAVGGQLLQLSHGRTLAALGGGGALRWNAKGAIEGGTIDVWCIGTGGATPTYQSSGLTLDVQSGAMLGAYRPCTAASDAGATSEPEHQQPESSTNVAVGTQMSDAGAAPDEPDAATAPDAGAIADAATAMEPEPTSVDAAVSITPLTAAIPCGAEQCDPMTGAYCCISTLRNAPDEPLPEDLHCVTGESSCALALRCSSDNECAQGEACCGMGAATRCVAAASCSGGLRLGCESARDCPANTFCCAHIATDGRHYTAVSCDAQCSVLDGRVPLCDTTNDCTSTDAPRSCRISYVQPNLHVCLP